MDYLILQVEEKRLTVARFGIARHSAEMSGAAAFELDDEHTLVEAVRQVAAGTSGSPRVVLCLPPYLFGQRILKLPFNDLRKVREVLAAQLQGEIPVPVEELVLDAMAVAEGQFLVLWVRKSDISQAVAHFSEAGIEPQMITSSPFAWSWLPGLPADCAVCDGSAVALLTAGRLSYVRAVDVVRAPATVFATLSALELSGTSLPGQLCLIGSGSGSLDECQGAPVAIDRPTVPADLGHLFKNEETFQQLVSLYAVAQACYAGALPDFRQGELAWTAGDAKIRKKLQLTGVLVLVVIAIVFTSQSLKYRVITTDIVSLNRSIAAIYREVFPSRPKAVDELSEIKGELKKLGASESSAGYLDILKRLADAKGVTINGLYEAELEGRTLRLKGDARSAQAVNEFKSALSGVLTSAQLGEIKTRPDGMVAFSLTGTIKEVQK
jgi:general secretion pathway protein L